MASRSTVPVAVVGAASLSAVPGAHASLGECDEQTATGYRPAELRRADIIVAAAGFPNHHGRYGPPGCGGPDVGVSRITAEDGHSGVAGDVDPQV
jgi:hypothetical protein